MCQVRLAKIDIETRKKGIGGVSSYQKERRFGHLIRAKHGPTQVCVVVSIRHRRTAVQAVGMRQVRCFVDGNADAGYDRPALLLPLRPRPIFFVPMFAVVPFFAVPFFAVPLTVEPSTCSIAGRSSPFPSTTPRAGSLLQPRSPRALTPRLARMARHPIRRDGCACALAGGSLFEARRERRSAPAQRRRPAP